MTTEVTLNSFAKVLGYADQTDESDVVNAVYTKPKKRHAKAQKLCIDVPTKPKTEAPCR